MIDKSQIKNKAIVTIMHNGTEVECEVVSSTLCAATIMLPDGSQCDVPQRIIYKVADEWKQPHKTTPTATEATEEAV